MLNERALQKTQNIKEPIHLNDTHQIGMLARDGTFQLHVDAEGRFIIRRDCVDNEYLDGVTVNEINLYCLKSEIEEMMSCATSETQPPNQRAESVANIGTGSQVKTERREKELQRWLRETWEQQGKPGETAFFLSLKKYVDKKGSPITEYYHSGSDAGISWKTSAGTTGVMVKKTIQTKVSAFKKNS